MFCAVHGSVVEDTPEKGTWQAKIKEYSLWMMDHNVSHEEVSDWLNKFLGVISVGQIAQKSHSLLFIVHSKSENLTSKRLSSSFFHHYFARSGKY